MPPSAGSVHPTGRFPPAFEIQKLGRTLAWRETLRLRHPLHSDTLAPALAYFRPHRRAQGRISLPRFPARPPGARAVGGVTCSSLSWVSHPQLRERSYPPPEPLSRASTLARSPAYSLASSNSFLIKIHAHIVACVPHA